MEKEESGSRTSLSTPTLQHSNTPILQSSDSNTPVLQSSPGWLEISISIHPVAHDALSAFLFDLGCEGLVTQELPHPALKGYLPLTQEPEKIKASMEAFLRRLASIFPEVEGPELSFEHVPQQDWNVTWRRFFQALAVTPRLTVVPPWEPIPAGTSGHVIRIDPGPAFGTGHHATTQMCLQALERLPKPEFWTMLDVGTGSGILGIYGAKLGCKRVLALDTDPEALRWAERNMALNKVSDTMHLSALTLHDIEEQFTIVVANLILHAILELLPLFCKVIEPDGHLILSGILGEQVHAVKDQLAHHAFENMEVKLEGEWACTVVQKKE
jgi:ribosomal protein L11 methyltransferase